MLRKSNTGLCSEDGTETIIALEARSIHSAEMSFKKAAIAEPNPLKHRVSEFYRSTRLRRYMFNGSEKIERIKVNISG